MFERVKHWKTSVAGLAISGILFAVFRSFNCQLPTDWLAWGSALLPAILGLLSKDS